MGEPTRVWTGPFLIAFVAHLLHAFGFHAFLHLPGMLQAEGLDELHIGVVVGTMSAAAIVSRPAIGWLTDERGRRVVLRAGGVVHVIAAASYLFIDGTGALVYVVRCIHGVAEGMLFTVLFTIAADLAPPVRRTEAIGIFGVSGVVPLALAGAVGDAVLAVGTYADLFWMAAVAAAFATLASWWLPESAPRRPLQPTPRRGFVASVTAPSLRPLWWVGFTFSLSLASYFAFIKTYVLATGLGSVGAFFGPYTAAAVFMRLVLGWVPDRLGPRRTLLPSLLVVALGLVLLADARTDLAVIVAGVACGIGHGFAFPILSALVVVRADASERGSALAMFTALFDLGLFVGAPLFGAVLAVASYDVMFRTAAGIVVVGAVVWLGWERAAGLRDRA